MQYIDKSTHRNEGHQIIDSFLESSWIAEDEQYINRSYNDLKKIMRIIKQHIVLP